MPLKDVGSIKNKKTASIIKLAAGLFMLATALIGFEFSLSYKLTFISNMSCALLLISDGTVYFAVKKTLPSMLYQVILTCICTVFCTVFFRLFGWHRFSFSGAFFFLHAINPIMFLIIYSVTTELVIKDKRDYSIRILIAPAMIMGYALFDYIRFLSTGKLVYGLIESDKLTFLSAAAIGVLLYLLTAFMSYGLQDLKLNVQKIRERGEGSRSCR